MKEQARYADVSDSAGEQGMDSRRRRSCSFFVAGGITACVWCNGKGASNQNLYKVTSLNYPKWFYYQWIQYYLPEFQHISAGKATTMGHIKRNHLSEAIVTL